jgi:L-alanine-DL-glutamate epimerase-like enolase superfamily enzyme
MEETPEAMAARAIDASIYPVLKIKVNDDRPAERISAVRVARPHARLVVDANQGWTFEQLVEVAPKMKELGVELIEQPLPRGGDERLEGYRSPVPLSADESCQHRGELDDASRRYQIINIKLDKAGGLTESILTAQEARRRGLKPLVSNMGGTSLSMAPAFVVAQLCDYVELDGQLLLKHDRFPSMGCLDGEIGVPDSRLWG